MLTRQVYTLDVEVGIRTFRENLKRCLDAVRRGEDVVVTDRGRPVAKLVAPSATDALQRLIREGVVTPPRRPKDPVSKHRRVRAKGSAAAEVLRQRRR